MKRLLVGLLMVFSVCTITVPQLTYAQEVNKAVAKGCEAGWFVPNVDPVCILLSVTNWFLKISAFFLFSMATLFEISIDYSLNIKNLLDQIPIVNVAWAIFRDLANLSFIFILLYASINIILGTNGYNVKAILTKVIFVAVFINFSLFFTKLTVDISNIAALQFYSKLIENAKPNVDGTRGLTHSLMSNLGLTTFFTTAGKTSTTEPQQIQANESTANRIWKLILTALMGIVFITVTAFVLGAAAIMFVIRSASLIFLMMLSPLAFAATIIPGYSGEFEKWKTALFKQAFFAPIYMALFYTVIITLDKWSLGKGGSGLNIETLAANSSGTIEIVFSFTVLTVMMLGCLMIAEKGGAKGSGVASKWGNTIAKMPLNWAKAGAGGIKNFGATLGSATANVAARSGWMQTLATNRVTGALGGRGLLRKTDNLGKNYRDTIEKKQKLIEQVGKVVGARDQGLVQGEGESDKDFEKRKKDASTLASNLAMGLTGDGQGHRGVLGFTAAGRNARRAIIGEKAKEAKKKADEKEKEDKTGKKAVFKTRLQKMLYGDQEPPDDNADTWEYKEKSHHASSGMGKVDEEIKNITQEFNDAANPKARKIAELKLQTALQRRDKLVDTIDDIKTQMKIEEERLSSKFDDLIKKTGSK